ncbi:hypothetical protein NDU88_001123 [Pleurodeles waltl]|uniref:Uncharacterized protein n=1 Tax=Pleurodeles waltl TaxID=8319 RepID=A0AAV7TJ82_PLEWA|nr:hypothetical protein NDU88_001123 [Pleurodeles waltl]
MLRPVTSECKPSINLHSKAINGLTSGVTIDPTALVLLVAPKLLGTPSIQYTVYWCSRLSSDTALDSSAWRCPHETEESVPRCRGNQGAGACPTNPDVRIPGGRKSENGLRRRQEEDDGDAEDRKRMADGGAEESKGRPGNPDVPRKAADLVQERSREETRRNRHVPGGAWLSKVQSIFKGQRFETKKCWDRGEEGRDGEEGLGGEQLGAGREGMGENRERDIRDNNSSKS